MIGFCFVFLNEDTIKKTKIWFLIYYPSDTKIRESNCFIISDSVVVNYLEEYYYCAITSIKTSF